MKVLASFTCALLVPVLALHAAPSGVQVVPKGGGFELLRHGAPYLVKGGGGGENALESLAKAGGNSVRLWGDDHLGEILDRAQKLGLTVTAGIWLGQVRQGFDWSDAAGLIKQREHIRAVVEKYKTHPALLCWALGNEMEDPQGHNGAVWSQINNLARLVKELDPQHPTMTVIAEIGGDKVKNFTALCPDIDILGINSYGGAASVAERYKKLGGTKPFLMTEYGPNGIWESNKDSIGAFPEPTSTDKAESYRRAYKSTVLGSSGMCLGSYAFLWGQKQEVTATWFSMFLADGTRLGAAEAISELWTGQPPANHVPVIKALTFQGSQSGKPGATGAAVLEASDPEGDPLKVTWLLERDPGEYGSGGDKEAAPPSYPDSIIKADQKTATITFPKDGGLYRLFATVRDDHGGGAVVNVTLRVDAPATIAKGQPATLPLTVYAEESDPATYIPAGWMGDTKAIKLNPACPEQPHSGKTCLRCDFEASAGWGGVTWQNPAGDWGDRSGGYDLTGAKKLAFWARGKQGGETVAFQFGTPAKPKKFFDTGSGKLEKVTLTKDWQRHEIDVAPKTSPASKPASSGPSPAPATPSPSTSTTSAGSNTPWPAPAPPLLVKGKERPPPANSSSFSPSSSPSSRRKKRAATALPASQPSGHPERSFGSAKRSRRTSYFSPSPMRACNGERSKRSFDSAFAPLKMTGRGARARATAAPPAPRALRLWRAFGLGGVVVGVLGAGGAGGEGGDGEELHAGKFWPATLW